jgi:hypothetical protein
MLRIGLTPLIRPLATPSFRIVVNQQSFTVRTFSGLRLGSHNVKSNFSKGPSKLFSSPFLFQSSRKILTDSEAVVSRPPASEAWKRFGITAVSSLCPLWNALKDVFFFQATVVGGVILIQTVLNRETRDGLSPAEQSYLNDSFKYTGGALALTALGARALFQSGFAYRLMATNPCETWITFTIHFCLICS